ncbi:MAG: hypothetical protein NXI30_04970 [bacterium]|nr:hypothetical protein [bacterium]
MKRMMQDVVGRPITRETTRGYARDVAGASFAPITLDVASFRHALDDPMGTAETDAEWLAEFSEFMAGDDELDRAAKSGGRSSPDPMFRERLRRRLWRTHVLANVRDSGETH